MDAGSNENFIVAPLRTSPYADNASHESQLVTHSLRGEGFDASEDGTGRGTPLVAVPSATVIAYNLRGREGGAALELTDVASLRASSGGSSNTYVGVRRLMPVECERLQGFPDGYTLVNHRGRPAADGPRYKAIGNSMAVPVVRWIGERIREKEADGTSSNSDMGV